MYAKLVNCCKTLDIPLALEKVEALSTSSFLGMVIDTIHMQLWRLPC